MMSSTFSMNCNTKQQDGDEATTSPFALRNIMDSSSGGAWDDLMFGADEFNKLGGFDPTSLSSSLTTPAARRSSYPPRMPENQDIFDILTEVENVLDDSSPDMLMCMSNNNLSADDLFLPQDEQQVSSFLLEPTPIGSANQVQIVDQVPVTDSVINVLDQFMSLKRKMAVTPSDESPFKKQRIIMPSAEPALSMSSSSTQVSPASDDDGNDKTSDESKNNKRFRSYQEEQWWERFTELMEFNKMNGHCLVPHKFPENPLLAQWVKRQRYQYKLKSRGDHSTLSDDRQHQLEALGFVWDSHRAAWDERFHELRSFQLSQGHVNVPSGYKHNPTLAVWVKCQRRQYRLYQSGKPSNMNEERVEKLNSINFVWNPRQA